MSEHDFCVWLEGFLAARGTDSLLSRDLGFIAEVLARTKVPAPAPAPVQVPMDLKTDPEVLRQLKEAMDRQRKECRPQVWPQNPREPQRYFLGGGCPECGMGKDGAATGYVCPRLDCPSKLTVTCNAEGPLHLAPQPAEGFAFDSRGVLTAKVPE